jgi:hypothetical protein
MQAAHDAAGVPLNVGQVFQRLIGLVDASVEKNVEIDATDDGDPVEEPAERAQLVHGIPGRAEGTVEAIFDALESRSDNPARTAHVLGTPLDLNGRSRWPGFSPGMNNERGSAPERKEANRDTDKQRVVKMIPARCRVIDRTEQADIVHQAFHR